MSKKRKPIVTFSPKLVGDDMDPRWVTDHGRKISYVKRRYEALACPKCGEEVDPERSNFCKSCGINLNQHPQLEKKAFPEIDSYCRGKQCQSCQKFAVIFWGNFETLSRINRTTMRETRYRKEHCTFCGEEKNIKLDHHDFFSFEE